MTMNLVWDLLIRRKCEIWATVTLCSRLYIMKNLWKSYLLMETYYDQMEDGIALFMLTILRTDSMNKVSSAFMYHNTSLLLFVCSCGETKWHRFLILIHTATPFPSCKIEIRSFTFVRFIYSTHSLSHAFALSLSFTQNTNASKRKDILQSVWNAVVWKW